MKRFKNKLFVICHNIRSAFNVGSIFRTADAAGVNKIYLCGFTPTPYKKIKSSEELRNKKVWGFTPLPPNEKITKVSLGAEKYILFESCQSTACLIKKLKKEKIQIVALENNIEKGINYSKFKPKFPLALIVGHEVKGLPKNILDSADKIIYLPMAGKKESLNVATAFGVAAYEINKYRK